MALLFLCKNSLQNVLFMSLKMMNDSLKHHSNYFYITYFHSEMSSFVTI